MNNQITVGAFYKHFKGKNLMEKNLYEVVAINPKYTGDTNLSFEPMVIYRNLFQPGQYFMREYSYFLMKLSLEEQKNYLQEYKVQILTSEEKMRIKTPEFKEEKQKFENRKY